MNRPAAQPAALWAPALLAVTAAALSAAASPAYVSDELVLGVYAEQNNQGQRLATLHSGTSVETLGEDGEFTQVRLSDGTTGWVKTAYLTTEEPAIVRVKRLEEELDRSRATTPALAEAAARREALRLTRELEQTQADLAAARRTGSPLAASSGPAPAVAFGAILPGGASGPWIAAGAVVAALCGGFWLGYATLARRVKRKFGGLKVY